ncbi:type III pantothenate kinase [Agriterribacter sp.]|uniref:type III pantothenate kinase n=1 Tax=Agriterribacter sp. TaxID=2821509 RepID=UPI002CEA772D|nr:type III pantothenate kinase [Agriterribacter sp.]HTN05651.1 type III pantothenate kinase [Agriterribacter sp.]
MVTLCFDFGNTRLKYAVFNGRELQSVEVLDDAEPGTIDRLVQQIQPQKSILSSVINHNKEMERVLAEHSKFHLLTNLTKLPFTAPVTKPETIGADRLALSAGATAFFPGKHNLVIGLGTCITYNFISKYNQFLGGGISPGMEMRLKSLRDYTAKLPLVKADWNFPLMGYDTKTNITSGVILGMAKEIDGIIDAYSERYNNFNVLLTGGDSPYFAQVLKNKIFADPHLIYKGLYAISEYNN